MIAKEDTILSPDLLKFLNSNFGALMEKAVEDKKSNDDILGHIITSQDKYINTLQARVYEMEQILNAQGEDRKPRKDGSDETFMDDGATMAEDEEKTDAD